MDCVGPLGACQLDLDGLDQVRDRLDGHNAQAGRLIRCQGVLRGSGAARPGDQHNVRPSAERLPGNRAAEAAARPVADNFDTVLNSEMETNLQKVEAVDVIIDRRPPKMIYDPQHPDANASGYVGMPDINVMEEMVNILSATRSYEANVAVINATKSMAAKALEIGR